MQLNINEMRDAIELTCLSSIADKMAIIVYNVFFLNLFIRSYNCTTCDISPAIIHWTINGGPPYLSRI